MPCILFLIFWVLSAQSQLSFASVLPGFTPCDPESETLATSSPGEPPLQFCAEWNPDFSFNGNKCCGKVGMHRIGRRSRRHLNRCSSQRASAGYCSEVTDEQKNYEKLAQSGKLGDILEIIKQDIGKKGEQAFCSVNNGFLAHGRPVVPTKENGILLKSRDRCLYFGTDPMVGMLEWLGREVSKEALNLRVVVGDISGPRGGCLFGRSGKRGHASHTSGQDADIGFLSVNSGDQTRFDHHFDAVKNWWFLKKIFKNPIACVKVAFLDRRLIRLLTLAAKHDPEWSTLRRFIRHIPGHKNHLHIRVGKGPGEAGCGPDARPELEVEEDDDSSDIFGEELDASILDELKSRQGASIQE